MADSANTASSSAAAATATASAPKLGMIPWIEKYRPQTMDDVVGNADTVTRLRIIAQEGNLPNLMLSGPPGTGKTTSMLCLARELLGEHYKEAVLELNASDDRGLDVVRNKIKQFAQKKVSLPDASRHKIVILDEADSMTGQAQQALRRTMELHSATTRFAFACNNSSKMIEPIQSRCAVVRFSRLQNKEIEHRIKHIIEAEGIDHTPDGIEAVLYVAEGDMRSAINCLQATSAGFGKLNADNVFRVCDQPPPIIIEDIYKQCLDEKNINEAHKTLSSLMSRGYAASDVISSFFKVAQNSRLFRDEESQLQCLRIVGETNLRIAEGSGSMLQLVAMLSKIMLHCKGA